MLLLEALKWNRSDYVQVLLDDGVQLHLKYMKELYSTVNKLNGFILKAYNIYQA